MLDQRGHDLPQARVRHMTPAVEDNVSEVLLGDERHGSSSVNGRERVFDPI
jgi:hypothetical protein